MNTMLKKAVILAAGMGTRLRNVCNNKPKGFIQIGKKPIIEESIEKLLKNNIREIIIATGYLSQFYEDLSKKYTCIKTIKNEKYSISGSMYSLYCARKLIDDDFLIIESDLIYDSMALKKIISFPESDVILISGFTNASDEVFVETKNNTLINMSKDKSILKNITGEFVGISKISMDLYKEMIKTFEEQFKNNLLVDYEVDGLVCMAKAKKIYCCKIENLLWGEIDDYHQYIRAKEDVYPKLAKI